MAKNAPPGPPPPPDPVQALQAQLTLAQNQPTWEDAVSLMRQDGPRGFRIDIETDSTISGDLLAEQQGMTELLQGITSFMSGIGPAVESGLVPVEVAKNLLLAAVRRFRMGKQIEDSIDQIGDTQGGAPQPKVDPKAQEVEFKQKNLEFQIQQAQADAALKTRQMQLDERGMGLKEQEQEQRAALEGKKLDLEHQREATQIGLTHQRESQSLNLEQLKTNHDIAHQNAQHQLDQLKAVGEHMRGLVDQTTSAIPAAEQHVKGLVDNAASALHATAAQVAAHLDRHARGVIEHAARTLHAKRRFTIVRDKTGRASGIVVEPDEAAQQ